jgi:hypothetical protein
MSMSYVSNSDVLNFLYAIGADLDLMFQVLWKHVLCIEFIRMRFSVNNEETSRGVFGWIADRFNNESRRKKAVTYLREWEGTHRRACAQKSCHNCTALTSACLLSLKGSVASYWLCADDFRSSPTRSQFQSPSGLRICAIFGLTSKAYLYSIISSAMESTRAAPHLDTDLLPSAMSDAKISAAFARSFSTISVNR